MSAGRVTVTLPLDLLRDIDRREKNRSKFVADAVPSELVRRRREELHRSLDNPHPESAALAEEGFDAWVASLHSNQRFPVVCVVPITGTPGSGLLYPALTPGRSGLAKQSFALIDHLRSIDKRRIRVVFGKLANDEISAIDEELAAFLGMAAPQA